MRWLQQAKKQFGSQTHDRNLKAWRWEMQFSRELGVEWYDLKETRDKVEWAKFSREWAPRFALR